MNWSTEAFSAVEQSLYKPQAPPACLGKILDCWGTFWTMFYAILFHLELLANYALLTVHMNPQVRLYCFSETHDCNI